jgi:hypothetical protein
MLIIYCSVTYVIRAKYDSRTTWSDLIVNTADRIFRSAVTGKIHVATVKMQKSPVVGSEL